MPGVRIIVFGHVQGVFFRAETKRHAEELDITGWVTNREDGNVEIHAEGSPAALARFKEWCAEGPSAAQVEHIEIQEVPERSYGNFSVV